MPDSRKFWDIENEDPADFLDLWDSCGIVTLQHRSPAKKKGHSLYRQSANSDNKD